MVSTVYLVVTVTVNRRQVAIPVVAMIPIEVMDFDPRLRREDESMNSSDISRLRGFVNPLLELKDRHLQLAPG